MKNSEIRDAGQEGTKEPTMGSGLIVASILAGFSAWLMTGSWVICVQWAATLLLITCPFWKEKL